MTEKDLDRIETGVQALLDSLEGGGKVAIFSYSIETDEGELVSNVLSTACHPAHYLSALAAWTDQISTHVENHTQDH